MRTSQQRYSCGPSAGQPPASLLRAGDAPCGRSVGRPLAVRRACTPNRRPADQPVVGRAAAAAVGRAAALRAGGACPADHLRQPRLAGAGPRGCGHGDWLEQIERESASGRWRVASDLNWRRLKYWRRVAGAGFGRGSAPGAAESVSEITVEHGPHAVVQAWELMSWLANQLGWHVLTGKVRPGVEISWRFASAQAEPRIRIRRLEQGPPEIRRVQHRLPARRQARQPEPGRRR